MPDDEVLRVMDQADLALGTAGLRPNNIFREELTEARTAVAALVAERDALRAYRDASLARVQELIESKYRWIDKFSIAEQRAEQAEGALADARDALRRIADYAGSPSTPIRNSVKKSAIARAALLANKE